MEEQDECYGQIEDVSVFAVVYYSYCLQCAPASYFSY